MTLEHDLLKLASDAIRSLMTGRDFGTGQTGHYLNIIRRIEDELNRPKPERKCDVHECRRKVREADDDIKRKFWGEE